MRRAWCWGVLGMVLVGCARHVPRDRQIDKRLQAVRDEVLPMLQQQGAKVAVIEGPTGKSIRVDLGGQTVTARELGWLRRLEELEALNLGDALVEEQVLAGLAELRTLRALYLGGLPIRDAHLSILGQLPGLQELELNLTEITDQGLRSLRVLRELKRLSVAGTRVTETGIQELREALPNLQIVW